ncbi:glycosyl transferase [Phormidesmis priestleyi ULC007]|uniref:Glycosyl transferase n=1 Tax=Phormidesmis priestleyi ULC007 TaxID=1920490 RepID=A0A2T1D8K7_9CYAN|nr:bacteriohopanetetrol glucosamine biosynthesis glycosyltransferase HpnI [Phormidesmis priestleyi]PSB16776.1 glycosyl transferase [Phormidesmis priestleyi ULC007]PZO47667.1 MAG: glycosyl transferase [Phormidesmis priestleyi]
MTRLVESLDYLLFLPLFLCLSAIGYYGYAIYAAHRFFSQIDPIDPNFHPSVSILKPVCGSDRDAYKNLASFCGQDYPNYQIIFAVHDWADSGIDVIKQIIRDFPAIDIQLVVSDRAIGTNRKVSNVANAITKAHGEIILLADSDVYVEPNYLQQVVQPLNNPRVGVVTCLYRSITEGWLTELEALSSATEFLAGVLVSNELEGVKFAMGQTIVMRRSVLEEIGGFAAIADYLADDFQLGYLPTQAGYEGVLSHHIVDHVMATSTFVGALQRQLRWMVGIRASRPWGYLGLIFTYGTVASLWFLLITAGSLFGWIILIITWTMRLAMAWFIGVKSIRDPVAEKLLWLMPLRDLISFALWCYGFIGNTIKWRDHQFKLTRKGELVAYPSSLPEKVKSVIG